MKDRSLSYTDRSNDYNLRRLAAPKSGNKAPG